MQRIYKSHLCIESSTNSQTKMPSVVNAISNFAASIVGIFVSLFNSVFAVFHAIFALGADIVNSVLTVVKHMVSMVLELFQGVLGFIAANFIAIAVIGGAYYLYTVYQSKNRGTIGKGRARA
ncbi:hypothetical protein B0H34DRAFT_685078 [Crassisporium funariophilum]|nr:hypothetical protein B0H34DRAFT_685078 [Crassisporium funariophilum]